MPIGQLIVPGLRDGGMPWELITMGLGSSGIQLGGEFKKHNPGCNCCEQAIGCLTGCCVDLTVSGFPEPDPGIDHPNCGALNGTFELRQLSDQPEVAPHIAPLVPEVICILDLAVQCWYQFRFDGPGTTFNGPPTKWYWEIGFAYGVQTSTGETKWQVIIAISNESLTDYIIYKGPLTGGFIDNSGPFDQLAGTFDFNTNVCAVVYNPPCLQPLNEMMQWSVRCPGETACPTITCPCCVESISHECMYLAVDPGFDGGFLANPAAVNMDCADECSNQLNNRCFRLRRHAIDVCRWVLDGIPPWIDQDCFFGFNVEVNLSDCDEDPAVIRPVVIFSWTAGMGGDSEFHVFRGTHAGQLWNCDQGDIASQDAATYQPGESNAVHCIFDHGAAIDLATIKIAFGQFVPECPAAFITC